MSSPEARTQLGEAMFEELDAKIDRMSRALDQGGDANAEQLGRDLGGVLWQVGSIVTGAGAAAKGAVKLAEVGINVGKETLAILAAKGPMNAAEVAELGKGVGAGVKGGANGGASHAVGNLEPGNPFSTSIPRAGDRIVINQGQLPTCGPTSCAMVLNSAGIEVDLRAVISQSGVTSAGNTMPRLVRVLNDNGLPVKRILGATVEDIAAATENGDPAIVRMTLDRGGHAVVVDGVTIRNGQQVVAIRDPAGGRQYFTPIEEFRASFSGEAAITRRVR